MRADPVGFRGVQPRACHHCLDGRLLLEGDRGSIERCEIFAFNEKWLLVPRRGQMRDKEWFKTSRSEREKLISPGHEMGATLTSQLLGNPRLPMERAGREALQQHDFTHRDERISLERETAVADSEVWRRKRTLCNTNA